MKNRKKNTKLILLLLLVCITLGYAALRTGLNINGTANVSSSSWNVHFENYQMSNATNITPTTEPVITGTTTTSISYEVDLDVPGDLYEFSVEVVNGGSLDALISLVSKYNGNEIDAEHPVPAYITYTVTDENGAPIEDDHRLDSGDREIVKVYIKYRDDDPSVLPGTDAPGLSFDIEIEATQAEKGTPTDDGPFTLSWVEDPADGTHVGQAIPNNIPIYTSIEDVTNAWEDSAVSRPNNYFLKHKLNSNNVITESYLGLVINDAFKEEWKVVCEGDSECEADIDNILNGTYYIKGGDSASYSANIALLKQIYGYSANPDVCKNYGDAFYCENTIDRGTTRIALGYEGGVSAYSYNGSIYYYCRVEADQSSYCGKE